MLFLMSEVTGARGLMSFFVICNQVFATERIWHTSRHFENFDFHLEFETRIWSCMRKTRGRMYSFVMRNQVI